MLKYHNLICFFLLHLSIINFAQHRPVDLAIQTGHVDKITHVCTSSDGRFIASYGADQKIIVWETSTASQFLFEIFQHPVVNMQFDEHNQGLFIATSDIHYYLDLASNVLSPSSDKLDHDLSTYTHGAIKISLNDNGIVDFYNTVSRDWRRLSSDYSDEPFNHFVYSEKNGACYVACTDGNIYVYDSTFKSKYYLKGHYSSVNSLALSPDELYLYSASDDRTIIQWNLKNSTIEKRFYGRCFKTQALHLNDSSSTLTFGDEIGQVKSIQFDENLFEINKTGNLSGGVHFTYMDTFGEIYFAGEDNVFYLHTSTGKHTYQVSKLSYGLLSYQFVTKVLKLYKPPFIQVKNAQVNKAGTFLIYTAATTKKYGQFYELVDLKNNKNHQYIYATSVNRLAPVQFLNDSVFFTLDCDTAWENKMTRTEQRYNSISFWMIEDISSEKIWHVETPLNQYFQSAHKLNDNALILLSEEGNIEVFNLNDKSIQTLTTNQFQAIFYLENNLIAAENNKNEIFIYRYINDSLYATSTLIGHQDSITDCIYDPDKHRLFTSSEDATIRVWNLDSSALVMTIIPIGATNAIYVTPDNYYFSTSRNLNSFGFKIGMDYFYPEQFDLIYNRPDIILERMQYSDVELIDAYKQAYYKRLTRMGYQSDSLQTDFHLPELTILNRSSIPQKIDEDTLTLQISAKDDQTKLDRLQLWVNDVAIFGTKGMNLRSEDTNQLAFTLKIPLALGGNKIQISVINSGGAESYKSGLFVECTAGKQKPDLYLVSIGCSQFQDSKYNLNYAAKDAEDITNLFLQNKMYAQVYTKTLLNEEVTIENFKSLKSFFSPADINDDVILFFAGHGVLDKEFNYFLASHDMDFTDPQKRGIAYTEFENLVDGIAPLRKIIFLDACHSGELDKTEVEFSTNENQTENQDITFRKVGNQVNQLQAISTSELSKSLFADLRRGTGATVISSAGGMEFAIESNQWQNGLFTYCLISGLKSGKADIDRDGKILLSELQIYVFEQVTQLSNGRQQPTSRIENNTLDYLLWE